MWCLKKNQNAPRPSWYVHRTRKSLELELKYWYEVLRRTQQKAVPRSQADIRSQQLCLCVFFSFILDVKFVGSTSRGHTGFLIHLPSAVRASIIPATRIQPFLSLIDREVKLIKIPVTGIRTHVPACQKVTRLPTELPYGGFINGRRRGTREESRK